MVVREELKGMAGAQKGANARLLRGRELRTDPERADWLVWKMWQGVEVSARDGLSGFNGPELCDKSSPRLAFTYGECKVPGLNVQGFCLDSHKCFVFNDLR